MEMFPTQPAAEPARRARRKPALRRWKSFPIRATREYLLALLPGIPDVINHFGLQHASLACRAAVNVFLLVSCRYQKPPPFGTPFRPLSVR